MAETATEQQAEQVLAGVRRHYGIPEGEEGSVPALYAPGHEGEFWCIWWEEGPFDWAVEYEAEERDPAVYLEPVNGSCLGIYPS